MANRRPSDSKSVASWLFSGILLGKVGVIFRIPEAGWNNLEKEHQIGDLDERQETYTIDFREWVEREGRHGEGARTRIVT